jgi:hypothetical protein
MSDVAELQQLEGALDDVQVVPPLAMDGKAVISCWTFEFARVVVPLRS